MDASEELRAKSDALLDDLAMLADLEQEKRTQTPDSPRLVELAKEIERLSARVLGASRQQRHLSEHVFDLAHADNAPLRLPSIEETPREIHLILAEWRDAERRAAEASPGSREERNARADIDRLRTEYGAAHEFARHRRR